MKIPSTAVIARTDDPLRRRVQLDLSCKHAARVRRFFETELAVAEPTWDAPLLTWALREIRGIEEEFRDDAEAGPCCCFSGVITTPNPECRCWRPCWWEQLMRLLAPLAVVRVSGVAV